MSKNNKGKPASGPKASPAPVPDDVKGWDDLNEPEIDAWWQPIEGEVLTGQIVGAIVIADHTTGQPRDIILIKTSKPVSVSDGDGDVVQAEPGTVVGASVRAKMTKLLDYVEHRGLCRIEAKGKVPLKGGRKMWEFDVRAKGRRTPWIRPSMRTPSDNRGDADDSDFMPIA